MLIIMSQNLIMCNTYISFFKGSTKNYCQFPEKKENQDLGFKVYATICGMHVHPAVATPMYVMKSLLTYICYRQHLIKIYIVICFTQVLTEVELTSASHLWSTQLGRRWTATSVCPWWPHPWPAEKKTDTKGL